ncbi:MAG: tetraacyldisaccharide 4'-kinase [Pseudomonadota bacterium]
MAAHLLAPAGFLVGAVAARRMNEPPKVRPPVPVVCIGNPTVGGSGKTPIAIAVAQHLLKAGHQPTFLTRGYGGTLSGPIAVAPQHLAREAGDEPLLLARHAPVVVAKDRAAGAELAATLGNVIVIDDGFQNPAVAKDFSALVIDGTVGLGNGAVTPAGPLRAPLAAHLPHASALIVVGGTGTPAIAIDPPCPVYQVTLEPHTNRDLKGQNILAFAGIGRPQKVFEGLTSLGANLSETIPLGDHAPYGEALASRLLTQADAEGLLPVTTAKDMVRLQSAGPAAQRLAARTITVDVTAHLPDNLVAGILSAVTRRNA